MMKKIIEIGIIMILLLSFGNTVNASSGYGNFTESATMMYENDELAHYLDQDIGIKGVKIVGIEGINTPVRYMQIIPAAYWEGNTGAGRFQYVTLWIDSVNVGCGDFGYSKTSGGDYAVMLWFNDVDFTGLSGTKEVIISGYTYNDIEQSSWTMTDLTGDSTRGYFMRNTISGGGFVRFEGTLWGGVEYDTSYEWDYSETLNKLSIDYYRDSSNPCKVNIVDKDSSSKYLETSAGTTDFSFMDYTEGEDSPYTITCEYNSCDELSHYIDFSESPPAEAVTIITNKTAYNTSEKMLVTWENVGYIGDNCYDVYGDSDFCYGWSYFDVVITTDDIIGHPDHKMEWRSLISESGNLTIDCSYLVPYTNYKAQIMGPLGDIVPDCSFDFTVESDGDFITTNYDGDAGFSRYPGEEVVIYYSCVNVSDIKVYDDGDNLMKTYEDVLNQHDETYLIPIDDNYNNEYENWYVTMDDGINTLRTNLTVYWKIYVAPTETPDVPYHDIDANIDANIDELKEGVTPILDLIYGICGIFVDNPDYDNDGIMSPDETKSWFNSLIPIVLFLGLFIIYKVFKRG